MADTVLDIVASAKKREARASVSAPDPCLFGLTVMVRASSGLDVNSSLVTTDHLPVAFLNMHTPHAL